MNPIIRQMMGNNANGMLARAMQAKQMLGGNPDAMFRQMMQNNPQFAQFVQENQGRTPEQIAQAYGIDVGMLNQLMR